MKTTILSLACLVSTTSMVGGCGSSTAAKNPDAGSPGGSACTVTLAGGVANVNTCAVTLAYDGTNTATDFSLSTTNIDPDTVPNLYATIQIAGKAMMGTFLSTDANVFQGLLAVNAGDSTDAWSADSESVNTAATGAFTLAITAVGTATSVGGSSYYTNTHGSLDATLIPVTAGQTSPAVMAHAEF